MLRSAEVQGPCHRPLQDRRTKRRRSSSRTGSRVVTCPHLRPDRSSTTPRWRRPTNYCEKRKTPHLARSEGGAFESSSGSRGLRPWRTSGTHHSVLSVCGTCPMRRIAACSIHTPPRGRRGSVQRPSPCSGPKAHAQPDASGRFGSWCPPSCSIELYPETTNRASDAHQHPSHREGHRPRRCVGLLCIGTRLPSHSKVGILLPLSRTAG